MKTEPSNILLVTMVCLCGFALVGCQKDSTSSTTFSLNEPVDQADDDEHDHGAGDDHDHPEHGQRGGHMIQLSNDSKTEVHFDEEAELFSIYVDGLGDVTKVQMTTTISDKDTVYEFERSDTPVGPVYGLLSPELATAVKMGKDAVQTELRITTSDGDLTAQYEYHSH